MEQKDKRAVGKCFGSTVVGSRGQLVIPAAARKELGIDGGAKLLVFSHFQEKGLILIKVDAVEELVNLISHHTDEVIKMLRNNEVAVPERENEGD
ncbi:MAG: AbrB/MazE/SpoVT family DNA-binding domain-containing protein [Dehalococcoidia bacterium]|nr:AbrB/MazE/SpoVT family DNA-binding domain-containing protein [Dehalococcoidia bacterium]